MRRAGKTFIILLYLIVFTISCNKKEDRNPQFLAAIDIQIPYELIENIETVDFFKSTENEINEFSDNIEKMVFKGKDILLKDPQDRSDLEKNKFGMMSVQFVSNTTQLTGILEETKKYIENARGNGFDEDQLNSLETIEDTLENRINDINNKYNKYFK